MAGLSLPDTLINEACFEAMPGSIWRGVVDAQPSESHSMFWDGVGCGD